MYERILVPTDGSPEVDAVLDHAGGLATAHDADLHALYVINTAATPDYRAMRRSAGWTR